MYCKMSKWAKKQRDSGSNPDRGAGNDPEPFFNFFLFFIFLGGWVFHNQGSTFLQWAIWE